MIRRPDTSLLSSTWLARILVAVSIVVVVSYEPTSILISRGVNREDPANTCGFVGDVTISHPQSIEKDDRFFVTGSLSLEAVNLVLDRVNAPPKCGITMGNQNYSVALKTYGDDSTPDQHIAIGNFIANDTYSMSATKRTDFLIGGYSSGLTKLLSPIAQANQKLLVAGGSTQTKVFQGRDYAYGILPPSSTYLDNAFAAIHELGAKRVASLTEDGVGSCVSVPSLAEYYNLELVDQIVIQRDPEPSHFDEVAYNMSIQDPDVMVTCVYDVGCSKWIAAMRRSGWNPKAQIFTVCIGTTELEDSAGVNDIAYMMGATSWIKNLPPVPDGATGWTPEEFATNFESYSFRNVSYQTAGAATSVSVLVQAIERADTFETDAVRDQVANGTFYTMYGRTSFDENGQNMAPSLLVQYDVEGKLNIKYPPEQMTDPNNGIVYPMPSWDQRDCLTLSLCHEQGGFCQEDGTCSCGKLQALLADKEENVDGYYVPLGKAANASCKLVPREDMSYVNDNLIHLGWAMFAGQALFSALFIIWTIYYRDHQIVKASQPFFLILIALGAVVMASSIVPLSMQNGDYRYEIDPNTGKLSDVLNEEIARLDMACMAFPWLCGMGFAIIFAALFAKIWRIKKLMQSAASFRRKQVNVQDVLSVMIVMLVLQGGLLLAWQLVDPLRWQRTVTVEDSDGYPIESVGSCESERAIVFLFPIFCLDLGALLYAVWLCYVTRNVPSDFSESTWITASVAGSLQILALACPVLIIASEESNADFFVRAAVTFAIGASVTNLIFFPKIVRMWYNTRNGGLTRRSSLRDWFTSGSRRNVASGLRNVSGLRLSWKDSGRGDASGLSVGDWSHSLRANQTASTRSNAQRTASCYTIEESRKEELPEKCGSDPTNGEISGDTIDDVYESTHHKPARSPSPTSPSLTNSDSNNYVIEDPSGLDDEYDVTHDEPKSFAVGHVEGVVGHGLSMTGQVHQIDNNETVELDVLDKEEDNREERV